MCRKTITAKILSGALVAVAVLCVMVYAQKDAQTWSVHSEQRPHPPVIVPPDQPGKPPSDAIVLFDGTDTSQWQNEKGGPVGWKVENGYMEVNKTGSIRTKSQFGNCQLHIEWRTPAVVSGTSQGRGNSGIFLMNRYELQVLDSYENITYADGQAAAIYGQSPPIVNVSRRPGEWQSYDVSFLRPIFDSSGNCIRKARVTILHNGVVVHNNLDIQGSTAHKQKAKYSAGPDKAPISLQDHGNPIAFRNIWIRELPEEPYLIGD